MTTATRLRGLAKATAFYAVRPSQWPDIPRWRADSARSTVEARSPWWPYPAIAAVGQTLPVGARVFEFGGGGSTVWLCDRAAKVTCVEHDREWFTQLQDVIGDRAELILCEPDAAGTIQSEVYPGQAFDSYVDLIAGQPDSLFDLVIVDGRARVACGLAAMGKVRPGGMLLLDDSDRDKYRALREALTGWPVVDYRGLKPGGRGVCQTSVWLRP